MQLYSFATRGRARRSRRAAPADTGGREQARRLGERLRATAAPRRRPHEPAAARPRDRGRGSRELGRRPEAASELAPGATADGVRAAVADRARPWSSSGTSPTAASIAAALSGWPEPPFPPAGSPIARAVTPRSRSADLRKSYGARRPSAASTSRSARARCSACSARTGREDDDRRDPRGLPEARRRRGDGPRRRPGAGRGRRFASASASSSSRRRLPEPDRHARSSRLFAGYYPSHATWTRCSSSSGSRRSATPACGRSRAASCAGSTSASRWSAIPSWSSSTSRRPASTRRAPRRLGHDPLAALARQDDPPDNALPRGGGAARRPPRRPARGPHRPRRDAPGARRTNRETEIRYRRNGEEVVVRTDEPTRVLHELTAEAIAAGRELEGARGAAADARGRLPRS